jgi:UDP-N-acetyl-D-glucosamine dehydrogenase
LKSELLSKIENREAVVGVIGLGYVGLPLLLRFIEKGFHAIGLDIDVKKTEALMKGQSYIKHIPAERVQRATTPGLLQTTNDFSKAKECDAILIAVPTPLNKNREPDMSYIISTCESIVSSVRRGQVMVLESTTYPGTTEEVMVPILEKSGLRVDKDFFVAFSPEREDPNRSDFTTETIPKVVGATSADGLSVAEKLYQQIIVRIVPIWEFIDAAKTKPFGYMPFYPGPGLGGHCIPIDPFYLTWKAREYGVVTKFIELAGEINTAMPEFVVQRAMEALNDVGRPLKGSRILILGLAYKANVDDDRESPSYHLMEMLEQRGAVVSYNDPYIPTIRPSREFSKYAGKESVEVSDAFDLILVSTAHDAYKEIDFEALRIPVIDTRNIVGKNGRFVYKA